jgi:hypothetical protein
VRANSARVVRALIEVSEGVLASPQKCDGEEGMGVRGGRGITIATAVEGQRIE